MGDSTLFFGNKHSIHNNLIKLVGSLRQVVVLMKEHYHFEYKVMIFNVFSKKLEVLGDVAWMITTDVAKRR